MSDDKPKQDPKTFEQALADLEAIVAEVEAGKVGLEESIAKYEQGMKLVKHCRTILDAAEKRIETIRTESQPK